MASEPDPKEIADRIWQETKRAEGPSAAHDTPSASQQLDAGKTDNHARTRKQIAILEKQWPGGSWYPECYAPSMNKAGLPNYNIVQNFGTLTKDWNDAGRDIKGLYQQLWPEGCPAYTAVHKTNQRLTEKSSKEIKAIVLRWIQDDRHSAASQAAQSGVIDSGDVFYAASSDIESHISDSGDTQYQTATTSNVTTPRPMLSKQGSTSTQRRPKPPLAVDDIISTPVPGLRASRRLRNQQLTPHSKNVSNSGTADLLELSDDDQAYHGDCRATSTQAKPGNPLAKGDFPTPADLTLTATNLCNDEWLTASDIDVCLRPCPSREGWHRMYPGYPNMLGAGYKSKPFNEQKISSPHIIFILNPTGDHWVVGYWNREASEFTVYDPMEGAVSFNQVKKFMSGWISRSTTGRTSPVNFINGSCATQEDDFNCAIFCIAFVSALWKRDPIPQEVDPRALRVLLMREIFSKRLTRELPNTGRLPDCAVMGTKQVVGGRKQVDESLETDQRSSKRQRSLNPSFSQSQLDSGPSPKAQSSANRTAQTSSNPNDGLARSLATLRDIADKMEDMELRLKAVSEREMDFREKRETKMMEVEQLDLTIEATVMEREDLEEKLAECRRVCSEMNGILGRLNMQ